MIAVVHVEGVDTETRSQAGARTETTGATPNARRVRRLKDMVASVSLHLLSIAVNVLTREGMIGSSQVEVKGFALSDQLGDRTKGTRIVPKTQGNQLIRVVNLTARDGHHRPSMLAKGSKRKVKAAASRGKMQSTATKNQAADPSESMMPGVAEIAGKDHTKSEVPDGERRIPANSRQRAVPVGKRNLLFRLVSIVRRAARDLPKAKRRHPIRKDLFG